MQHLQHKLNPNKLKYIKNVSACTWLKKLSLGYISAYELKNHNVIQTKSELLGVSSVINERSILFMIDSGATNNFLSK